MGRFVLSVICAVLGRQRGLGGNPHERLPWFPRGKQRCGRRFRTQTHAPLAIASRQGSLDDTVGDNPKFLEVAKADHLLKLRNSTPALLMPTIVQCIGYYYH